MLMSGLLHTHTGEVPGVAGGTQSSWSESCCKLLDPATGSSTTELSFTFISLAPLMPLAGPMEASYSGGISSEPSSLGWKKTGELVCSTMLRFVNGRGSLACLSRVA